MRNSKWLAKNLEDPVKGYVSWPAIWAGAIVAVLLSIYYGVGVRQLTIVTKVVSLLGLCVGVPLRLLKRRVVPKRPEERGLPALYAIYFCSIVAHFALGVLALYGVFFVISLFL